MQLSHNYKNSILRNRRVDPDKEKKNATLKNIDLSKYFFQSL